MREEKEIEKETLRLPFPFVKSPSIDKKKIETKTNQNKRKKTKRAIDKASAKRFFGTRLKSRGA